MTACSTQARRASTARAKIVAGKAPDKIRLTSASCNPATMGTPSPPAPIKAARVAVPSVQMAEVRNHDIIKGTEYPFGYKISTK